jgi:hypothetical protein
MSQVRSDEIYYPISWIKTTTDLFLNLFSSPQKTKRSLPEEAESGSVEGIKCWLREGRFSSFTKSLFFLSIDL